jgi:hypothetical protein
MGFIFSSASLYLRKIAYNFSCSSGSAAVVVGYGHLGDGNVHLNVSAREYDNQVLFLFLFHWQLSMWYKIYFPERTLQNAHSLINDVTWGSVYVV